MSGDGLLLQQQPRTLGNSALMSGYLHPGHPAPTYPQRLHISNANNHVATPPQPQPLPPQVPMHSTGANKRKRSDSQGGNSGAGLNSSSNTLGGISHTQKRAKISKPSSSAPQLHSIGNATPSTFLPSPDHRKRNKLGYHRTSVACCHCRRRKIRCLPEPDDASGRCANCIRLKRECTFLPVDQANNAQKANPVAANVDPLTQRQQIPETSSLPTTASARVTSNTYSQFPTTSQPKLDYTFSPNQQTGSHGLYAASQASPGSTVASRPPQNQVKSPVWEQPNMFSNHANIPTTLPPQQTMGFHTWKQDEQTPMFNAQYLRPYSNYVASSASLSNQHTEPYATASPNGNEISTWGGAPLQRNLSVNNLDDKLASSYQHDGIQQHAFVPRRSATLPQTPLRHLSEQSTVTTVSEPTPGPTSITDSTVNTMQQQHPYVYPSSVTPWAPAGYGDGADGHEQQQFAELRGFDDRHPIYDGPWI